MHFAAIQVDNSVRGIENRLCMIERLLAQVRDADFVILPELSTPGYIPTPEIWDYREREGALTKAWAVSMAQKYDMYIGCGYLDHSGGEYYNAYLIACKDGVCGFVYKEEPESNLFKRGRFPHIIQTPLGKIAVAICFDAHRECFYESIKEEKPDLILMPHAWAMSVDGNGRVRGENRVKIDFLGSTYAAAFGVPVIFCNAIGAVDRMAGITGLLMKDFKLAGQSGVYLPNGHAIRFEDREIGLFELAVTSPGQRLREIPFYGTYIDEGSKLFRHVVVPLDIRKGTREYEKRKRRGEKAKNKK